MENKRKAGRPARLQFSGLKESMMEAWSRWRLWRERAGRIDCVLARQTWPHLLMERMHVLEMEAGEGSGGQEKRIIKNGL